MGRGCADVAVDSETGSLFAVKTSAPRSHIKPVLVAFSRRPKYQTSHHAAQKLLCPWVKLEAVFMYTALWLQAGAARPSFSQRFCTSLGLPATAASGLETCFLAGLKLAMLAYNLTWLF